MILCKIRFKGAFHVGEKEGILEDTSDYVHSDTIFSAICNAFRLLYGDDELEAFLDAFRECERRPPLLISSAFPRISDVLLFPLPMSERYRKAGKRGKEGGIEIKRVKFVSERIFDRIIKGNRDWTEDVVAMRNNSSIILVTKEESEELKRLFGVSDAREIWIWRRRETPRVVLDRRTNASDIYYFGEVVFNEGCGLFMLMDVSEEFENKVKASLRVLGDEGIGGDRTYGKGHFSVEFERNAMGYAEYSVDKGEFFVTLSLYYPREDEVEYLIDGYYEILSRGGWIFGSGLRRKTVRMLAEGAVVRSHEEPYGLLVDVGPEGFCHHVYRYGYAFPVPIVCDDEDEKMREKR